MAKNSFLGLRRIHGKIHDIKIEHKKRKAFESIIKKGYRVSKKQTESNMHTYEDYPVDFVVLWLDESDSKWFSDKEKYLPNDNIIKTNNAAARFRNWDNFHFWFRSVEKYAPWVRNVYLVTYGHLPDFINLEAPKLKCIRHDQFIPNEYLPTFNSNSIELNLWRISGISEHVVFFNDDMFLNRPVDKSDFFCNGLPKYCGVPKPSYPNSHMTTWEHSLFNNAGVVNDCFSIREAILNNPEKWFCHQYSKYTDTNKKHIIKAYEDDKILGMYCSHLGVPYRCSTMKAVWEAIPEKLDATCKNKFRTMDDVFHQLFQMWEVYNGTFEPVDEYYYGFVQPFSVENLPVFESVILNEKCRMVCPNDWEGIDDNSYELLKNRLIEIFSKKFPDVSSFEIKE